jgi:hypothetical protein
MTNYKNKDINVELLRIVACFLVIMNHIKAFDFTGANLNRGALLINGLVTPAVGIFFLISGFFLSSHSTIRRSWSRFFKRVALPAFVLVIVTGYLRAWLASPADNGTVTTLWQSIRKTELIGNLRNIVLGILAFDAGVFGKYTEHLWFVLSYGAVMIYLPILLAMIRADMEKWMAFLSGITLLRLLMTDITMQEAPPIQLYIPKGIPIQPVYCMLGYLLYQLVRKSRWILSGAQVSERPDARHGGCQRQIRLLLFFAAFYIVVMLLLWKAQFTYTYKGLAAGRSVAEMEEDTYYCTWLSGLGLLSSVGLSGMVLSLPLKRIPELVKRLIVRLGFYTYPIFLMHYMIVQKLRIIELEPEIKEKLAADGTQGAILYAFLYAAFIFIITLGLCILIHRSFCFLQQSIRRMTGKKTEIMS